MISTFSCPQHRKHRRPDRIVGGRAVARFGRRRDERTAREPLRMSSSSAFRVAIIPAGAGSTRRADLVAVGRGRIRPCQVVVHRDDHDEPRTFRLDEFLGLREPMHVFRARRRRAVAGLAVVVLVARESPEPQYADLLGVDAGLLQRERGRAAFLIHDAVADQQHPAEARRRIVASSAPQPAQRERQERARTRTRRRRTGAALVMFVHTPALH